MSDGDGHIGNLGQEPDVIGRASSLTEHDRPRRLNFGFEWLRSIFNRNDRRRESRLPSTDKCLQEGRISCFDEKNDTETRCQNTKRSRKQRKNHTKSLERSSSDKERFEHRNISRNRSHTRLSWSSFKNSFRRLRSRTPTNNIITADEFNITVDVNGQILEDSPVLQRCNLKASASIDETSSGKVDSGCLKAFLEKKEEYCIPRKICKIISCPWYWGNINRFEAAMALQAKSDGFFLLRKSAHPDFLFTISFKRFNKTMHVRIESGYESHDQQDADEEMMLLPWIAPGRFSPTYTRLLELIDVCQQPYEGSIYNMPLLVTPLKRSDPLSLKSIARAHVYSIYSYSVMESLLIPEELKMFVKEYRFKLSNTIPLANSS